MRKVSDIREDFEKKAMEGDGAFAIAFAILELAEAQNEVATKLSDLVTVLNPVVVSSLNVRVEDE